MKLQFTLLFREWTSLLSTLGGIEGKTCRSYAVRTKEELSTLLKDEKFGKADMIQLVELIMDKFDAPDTLKRGAKLSQMANSYTPQT
jgi:pyruvate decarboxylase